jgi:hypothetical protein
MARAERIARYRAGCVSFSICKYCSETHAIVLIHLDHDGTLMLIGVSYSASNMSDIDTAWLDNVCTHVGDAVIDPAIWPEILGQISAAVCATGAVLIQSDVRTSDIPVVLALTRLSTLILLMDGTCLTFGR